MIGDPRGDFDRGLLWSVFGHAAAIIAIARLWHPSASVPEPAPALIDVEIPSAPVPVPSPPELAHGVAPGPRTVAPPGVARAGARDSRQVEHHYAERQHDEPYGNTLVSYERGDRPTPNGTALVGDGAGSALFGSGYSTLGDGTGGGGGFAIPHVSHARGPSPRRDYSTSHILLPHEYSGQTVIVDLVIDARGNIARETLVQGLHAASAETNTALGRDDRDSVVRTILATIQKYEFYPALDDDGHPTTGAYRWAWQLTHDASSDPPAPEPHGGR